MHDSSLSPPALSHSPLSGDEGGGEPSTSESTPLHTPKSVAAELHQPAKRERDLYFSWHRKQYASGRNDPSFPAPDWEHSEPLFESDFSLFPDPAPAFEKLNMGTTVEQRGGNSTDGIDINLPPRLSNSQSPRNQTSTLTAALEQAGASGQHVPDNSQYMGVPEPGRLSVSGRHDSISNMFGSSYLGSGARPISVKDRQRRESNTGGSFMGNGMSWGGISVGSLRDDIMMTGTSPMPFGRSPSMHSSSYLPKMEAQFLTAFSCCGQKLDSLHDLLQHFEENHAQQSGQIAQRSSVSSQAGFSGNRRPSTNGEPTRNITPMDQRNMSQRQNSFAGGRDGFNRTQLSTVQDMDTLEDMEMDDTNTVPATPVPQITSPVNQQTPTVTPLNTSIPPNISAGQAFRTSTPSTPNAAQAFQLYSNPTVSSVNTPAIGNQPFGSNQQSPHTSVPGTPAEPNLDFSNDFMAQLGMGSMSNMNGMNGMNNMQMQGNQMGMQDDFDFGSMGFGLTDNLGGMTIDEPAKRLLGKSGGMTQQQIMYAIKNGQIPVDGEMQKKMREAQLVGGLGGPVVGLNHYPDQENKPFKCPVIGCEKAYKNQNGLKYHKQHGHNNQKLQENSDGTYSIVDPITSIPYPGTIGMEKEKPYQCPVCGKRYKNLNGLKYHKQHSAMCNPDLKLPGNPLAGLNPNANVAGNIF